MAWSRPTIVSGLTRATKALFDTYADAIDEAHEALDGRLSEADLNATYAPVSVASTKLDRTALRSLRPQSPIPGVPISTEGYATASSSLSLKTQAGTSKVPHTIGFDASDLRMVIHNWDFELGSTYTDVDAATDLPVRAAFLVGGAVYPVTFRGSRDATVAPGGYVVSDPLGVEVTQGDVIYTLIYTSATSWQPNRASYTSSNSGGFAADVDATSTGSTPPTNGASTLLAPAVVTGVPVATNQRSVATVGDSITAGAGDGFNGTAHVGALDALPRGGGGWLARAFRGKTGTVQIAQPGDRAAQFAQVAKHFRRAGLLTAATDSVSAYGINDLTDQVGATAVKQALIDSWRVQSKRGLRVWQPTLVPYSTSTDLWLTVANQSPFSQATARVEVNNWIRDGAPMTTAFAPAAIGAGGSTLRAGSPGHPLHAWFEMADSVESARNSGVWRGPLRVITDAEMTAGSRVITSSSANFSNSTDLYQAVVITGAGASGAPLAGFIGAVLSATQVNLSTAANVALNASTSVTGATLGIGVMTNDGLHPNASAAALMAATVPVNSILSD